MFRITDNNGATLIRGSKKKCMDFVKKQLDFQYTVMTLEKFDWMIGILLNVLLDYLGQPFRGLSL